MNTSLKDILFGLFVIILIPIGIAAFFPWVLICFLGWLVAPNEEDDWWKK